MIAVTITPYHRRHLQAIHDLLFQTELAHSHLDWYETDAWLESAESLVRLAWQQGRLIGALGSSRPLHQSCWIRLAAALPTPDPARTLSALWSALAADLRDEGVTTAALLGVADWTQRYAESLGFHYQEHIITLERLGGEIPPLPASEVAVRVGDIRDLPAMSRVDEAAFDPPWQLQRDEFRQAFRMASSCTVAIMEGEIVGYQLSTLYFDGGHLARLGVSPAAQGRGVGAALLHDLLSRFAQRSIHRISVNTQASNTRSQALYTRFGFRANGYDLPYFRATL